MPREIGREEERRAAPRRAAPRRARAGVAVTMLAACGGGSPPAGRPPAPPPPELRPPEPGAPPAARTPRPLARRLTRAEYDATVRDLLGDASRPAHALPREAANEIGFGNVGAISPPEAQLLMEVAEKVAAGAVERLPTLLPCMPASGEAACAKRFVEAFGRRAFRRPLALEERAAYEALYEAARKQPELGFGDAIGVVIAAMLQSPQFLYHWERGPADRLVREGGLVRLTPHQTASRLSYFLWGTMPDDALLAAADKGELATPEQIGAQVRRMMANAKRFGEAVGDFHVRWLGVEDIGGLAKDVATYAEWNPSVNAGMAQEIAAIAGEVLGAGDGKLETLLSTTTGFPNEALAKIHELSGIRGEGPTKVALDASKRAGILTTPGFLAVHASPAGSNPVIRGEVVYRQILCGELGSPPPDVPPIEPPAPNQTTRERFAMHAMSPCAACHKLIDPIGFAFEHYDGVGRYRKTDAGKPVDASGTATLPGGGTITFKNAIELTKALAKRDEVRRCVAQQWFRFAVGRRQEPTDKAAFAAAYDRFAKGGFDLRELFGALAEAKFFLYRAPAPGEVF